MGQLRQNDWDLKELMERLGGDQEFLRESLVRFREDVRVNLRTKICGGPIQTTNNPVAVTISIGRALSREFTECTVGELTHQADMAFYAAIAAGRNCVRVAQPPGIAKPIEDPATETQVLAP